VVARAAGSLDTHATRARGCGDVALFVVVVSVRCHSPSDYKLIRLMRRPFSLCLFLRQVEYLLFEVGASSAVRDVHGHQALHYARTFSSDKATIDVLRRSTPTDKDSAK
jgi:hypothetical protein